ncbi:uncharacterized protein HMPREF1541_10557 [Cyphellophora europaea CBS 101466]|uniref:Uncharacterized protein n=1 Tax=Cyphellophora europaea (strain CBS 101466) TaxID=1220924 RepID=W2S6U3_CYPE1|nr:uncharacterized protein HMPREF1541_10557 [Cyphellophora europaea CBS 101466]ETN44377.1 hypothetical protein HMPREF1541_10557 [Cyphellophora europaea CBS 101466]
MLANAPKKIDWKNHKILCSTFNTDRTGPFHRRALLFPGGSEPVRFEWVELCLQVGEGTGQQDFDSRSFFATNDKDGCSFMCNAVEGRNFSRGPDDTLVWFKKIKPPFEPAVDPQNLGLRSFTRGGACWDDFRSPVFVTRATKDKERRLTHGDMDMRDMRNAADYLGQTYRDGRVQQGGSKWDEIVLDGCDPIWNADGGNIANLLGFPILVQSIHNSYEVDVDPGYQKDELVLLTRDLNSTVVLPGIDVPLKGPQVVRTPNADENQAIIAQVCRRLRVGATGFGSCVQKYTFGMAGIVYVVRVDGKPFPREHAEALCAYIRDNIEPQLAAATAGLSENVTVPRREEILQSISKASFMDFFNTITAAKLAAGEESWRDLPSPYEIKHADIRERLAARMKVQQESGFEQSNEKMSRQERGQFIEVRILDQQRLLHVAQKDSLQV